MSEASEFDPYAMPPDALREPPPTLWKALRQIGPGIILAGSIIGTGELLVTTGLGAEHGFVFLWLILLSCVVKVFVQVELGRYTISSGKPTLAALDDMPGPRWGANWQVWWWLGMLLLTVTQLGAMEGGVGQALHLLWPQGTDAMAASLEAVSPSLAQSVQEHPDRPWALLTAIAATLLLLSGGYHRIEFVTTLLVAAVTLVTVGCVLALPFAGYPVTLADWKEGFSFDIPLTGIAAAFSAFGITGVGASELYAYPYWCLEKGYARYAGPRSSDSEWARRAHGWMRVLYLDAWVSMLVFTVATVSFYVMGATVLHRLQLHPEGDHMMEQLAQMYVEAFKHPWTKSLFLVGACVVLFKTLYVASAGHSRLSADFLSLAKLVRYQDPGKRAHWMRFFCVFYPALGLVLYLIFGDPHVMVVFGGFAQAATLPVIGAATIYLRYRRVDPRLAPSKFVDLFLWIAVAAVTVVAIYAIYQKMVEDVWPWLSSLFSGGAAS
ncbi:MAG TPA: Nramp family divalent metal transporter [Pirellulales bacterium]|nr:Nramp family divalent metal transporter [Pirellulales bacterium]